MKEQGFGDIIVVVIDYVEKDCIIEFILFYCIQLGVGSGKKYFCVLADCLKFYVDEYFCILFGCEIIGIGGSLMGGLISIYVGLIYLEVYGKFMIFFFFFWVSFNIFFCVMSFNDLYDMDIYIYVGEGESKNMVFNICGFM